MRRPAAVLRRLGIDWRTAPRSGLESSLAISLGVRVDLEVLVACRLVNLVPLVRGSGAHCAARPRSPIGSWAAHTACVAGRGRGVTDAVGDPPYEDRPCPWAKARASGAAPTGS